MLATGSEINPYLQQEVLSASPIRLRWMLVQRCEVLCGLVQELWAANNHSQAEQWLLRIREIIGELLDGVKDAENPCSKTITDFYIFLLQLSLEVESSRDPHRLQLLKELFAIESETWRQVVSKVADETANTATPNLGSPPVFPSLGGGTTESSFSFEA